MSEHDHDHETEHVEGAQAPEPIQDTEVLADFIRRAHDGEPHLPDQVERNYKDCEDFDPATTTVEDGSVIYCENCRAVLYRLGSRDGS